MPMEGLCPLEQVCSRQFSLKVPTSVDKRRESRQTLRIVCESAGWVGTNVAVVEPPHSNTSTMGL